MDGDSQPPVRRKSASRLKVSRRTFLGTATALPVAVARAGWVFADEDDIDDKVGLAFLLSADERILKVRRVASQAKGAPPVRSFKDWEIDARSFGPRAWFDMDRLEYDADEVHRFLVV